MSLSADAIRGQLGDAAARLETLEVLAKTESTNSYLMQEVAPSAGKFRIVATDNQTAGRGQHGRIWQSPPGSGLCLSMAYTFASKPENLPAMTLAVGLGVVHALKTHGIDGVQLKWPNDLVARNSKLGGILTETRSESGGTGGGITVVIGIGLNVNFGRQPNPSIDGAWAERAIDLRSFARTVPDSNAMTSSLVDTLSRILIDYEAGGFNQFRDEWHRYDWLRGRTVTIEAPRRQITGVAVGVAHDGALLLDTPRVGTQRISTGTVRLAEREGLGRRAT